jgi:hypothetical protein
MRTFSLTLFAISLFASCSLFLSAADTGAEGTIAAHECTAPSSQGSNPSALCDDSGLGEDPPGSSTFVHTAHKGAGGGSMWNSNYDDAGSVGKVYVRFDLGHVHQITGLYVWNYNEPGYTQRSVKTATVQTSEDDRTFTDAGTIDLRRGNGGDEPGQAVTLPKPVTARYVRLLITANYGDRVSGLSEVRFRVVKPAADDRVLLGLKSRPKHVAKYPAPTYARIVAGKPLAGAENAVFPADAGVIDVTKPPYNAVGDGKTNVTAIIQKALSDHPNQGAIIWLPNGVYLISDTLTWPHGDRGGWEEKDTILHGQSEAGTVIKLADHAAGFDNPNKPKPVIWTGGAPAQRFSNEIAHLTVDTGAGNLGCAGVEFTANNQGVMRHVTIVSNDGQGISGLRLSAGENGPLLITHLTVIGFDVGIDAAGGINSQTLEHITVNHQNRAGVQNIGQPFSLRHLTSTNTVPALITKGGQTVLLDSTLSGSGAAKESPAIIAAGHLVARGITTSGYARALDQRGGPGVATAAISEYLSSKPISLNDGAPASTLNLPIKDTPDVAWDALDQWTSPLAFGGKPDDKEDDTAAIQQAIDAGKPTVYLPRGSWKISNTIQVRGKVRRIIGCRGFLDLAKMDKPAFALTDGSEPVVVIERLSAGYNQTPTFDNASARTLVLKHSLNVCGHFTGTGPVFIEDCCSNPTTNWRIKGQTVWARQFNVENEGTHVINDGGTLWILGFKTERGGTLIETTNGGRTEVLGGFSYTTTSGKLAPMFVVRDATFAATFSEVCFRPDPYVVIVREERGGKVQELGKDDPRYGRVLTLFTTPRK